MKSLLSLVYAARAASRCWCSCCRPRRRRRCSSSPPSWGSPICQRLPPTAGLVAKFFGPANMATLFGIVMLSHQIGGFTGAWFGGKVHHDRQLRHHLIIDILFRRRRRAGAHADQGGGVAAEGASRRRCALQRPNPVQRESPPVEERSKDADILRAEHLAAPLRSDQATQHQKRHYWLSRDAMSPLFLRPPRWRTPSADQIQSAQSTNGKQAQCTGANQRVPPVHITDLNAVR